MDFENNEKKQEEPTQQEGFQREIRPGRSPRPRIHTGQRPTYERQSYRQNDGEEGGFRPEGFGAGLQSSAPQRSSYRPRQNSYEGGGYQQRPSYGQSRQGGYQPRQQGETVSVRVAISHVSRASMVSARVAMASSVRAMVSPVRVAMVSSVRVAMVSSVRATVSLVRVATIPAMATSPAMVSLTVQPPIRKLPVSIRPTTIRTLNTA